MSSWRWEEFDRRYAAAYKEHGLDVESLTEAQIADAIARSDISADLIVGLLKFAFCPVSFLCHWIVRAPCA